MKNTHNSLLPTPNHLHYTTQTAAPTNVATRASTSVLAGLFLPDAAPATSPFHPLLVLFPLPVEIGLFTLFPAVGFPLPLSIGNVSVIVGCIGQSSQTNILVVNPGGVVALIYSPE
jgi:hypothetical protein